MGKKIDKPTAAASLRSGLFKGAKILTQGLAAQVAVQGKVAGGSRQAGQSLVPADRFTAANQPVTEYLGAGQPRSAPPPLVTPAGGKGGSAARHNPKKAAKQARRLAREIESRPGGAAPAPAPRGSSRVTPQAAPAASPAAPVPSPVSPYAKVPALARLASATDARLVGTRDWMGAVEAVPFAGGPGGPYELATWQDALSHLDRGGDVRTLDILVMAAKIDNLLPGSADGSSQLLGQRCAVTALARLQNYQGSAEAGLDNGVNSPTAMPFPAPVAAVLFAQDRGHIGQVNWRDAGYALLLADPQTRSQALQLLNERFPPGGDALGWQPTGGLIEPTGAGSLLLNAIQGASAGDVGSPELAARLQDAFGTFTQAESGQVASNAGPQGRRLKS